jgi:hypothetical protein
MGHGGEDGNLALDHVLLALALGFVDDLGGEFSASLPVVAQPHHSEVAVTNNLQQGSNLPFSCHLQLFRKKKKNGKQKRKIEHKGEKQGISSKAQEQIHTLLMHNLRKSQPKKI